MFSTQLVYFWGWVISWYFSGVINWYFSEVISRNLDLSVEMCIGIICCNFNGVISGSFLYLELSFRTLVGIIQLLVETWGYELEFSKGLSVVIFWDYQLEFGVIGCNFFWRCFSRIWVYQLEFLWGHQSKTLMELSVEIYKWARNLIFFGVII